LSHAAVEAWVRDRNPGRTRFRRVDISEQQAAKTQSRERKGVHVLSAIRSNAMHQRGNIRSSKSQLTGQLSSYLKADVLVHRRLVVRPIDKPKGSSI
jgi:hypothetical protein